jgi:hypothetical protein
VGRCRIVAERRHAPSLALIPLSYPFDNRRPSQRASLATRAAGAQGGDPAFVSFFLLPLALVAPSFRRTRPSSHRLSIAPAGRGIDANTHLCVAFRLNRDATFAKSCPQDVIAPAGGRNTANATDRRGPEKPRTEGMRPLTTDDDGRRAGSARQRERPLPYYHHMNHDEEGSEPHRGLPRTRRRMHGCASVSNSQERNLILTRVAVCWKRDTDLGRRVLWPHGTPGA